ncbi:hypothetical protein O3M35_003278 [Rhynocoris fuscipes]|uniref:Uncharacterized protein n=1 Tax=Rhynocoris fuscipes TaxID=488301 RepID=A0AAW1CQB0_9HEMI
MGLTVLPTEQLIVVNLVSTISKEDERSNSRNSNEGVETLEEARKVIKDLRERHRLQSHQLLSWKRRYKLQEENIARINQERNEQLRRLSTQLILFEARLCRKQRDISTLLCQRETIIVKQQKLIKQLQMRLSEAGVETTTAEETNLDSLNDSDSAVIMEDDDSCVSVFPQSYHNGGVTVIRSVSDALDTPSCKKYTMYRRTNCLLRRPEVLETVYSVEEDADGDGTTTNTVSPTSQNDVKDNNNQMKQTDTYRRPPRLGELTGSFERLDPQPQQVTTYNRVMSNHRSVTKPKDVKYKRINKAKSKSLEELRGRLKNWVEKGNKVAISLDHSFA